MDEYNGWADEGLYKAMKGDEQMTHTPIPWKLDAKPTDYPQAVASSDGTVVAITGNDRANAAFIVRAVNSHADLLAALESIVGIIADAVDQRIRSGRLPPIAGLLSSIEDTAAAAIQTAKGETQ